MVTCCPVGVGRGELSCTFCDFRGGVRAVRTAAGGAATSACSGSATHCIPLPAAAAHWRVMEMVAA